jgi:hypothetical protein
VNIATAKDARALSEADLSGQLDAATLSAVESEILSSAICGSTSVGADYEGIDSDRDAMISAVTHVAMLLRKRGYVVKQTETFLDLDWSGK